MSIEQPYHLLALRVIAHDGPQYTVAKQPTETVTAAPGHQQANYRKRGTIPKPQKKARKYGNRQRRDRNKQICD